MKTLLTQAALVVALFAIAGAAANAQVKLGVVDVDVIVSQLPEFKSIELQLQQVRKAYEDTLTAIKAKFEEGAQNYQQQEALMTDDAKQQEQTRLNQIRDEFLNYQQSRLGQQGALYQAQEQLLAPVREKVRLAIEQIAQQQKLDAIMEKGVFVYSDKKLDVTFKVLDYIQQNSGK